MPDRTINFGESESEATYQIQDTDGAAGGGNFVIAKDTNANTVLLEYDPAADTWNYAGDVDMNGGDVSNVNTLSASAVDAATVGTPTIIDSDDGTNYDVGDDLAPGFKDDDADGTYTLPNASDGIDVGSVNTGGVNIDDIPKGETTTISRGSGVDGVGFQSLIQPTDGVSTSATEILRLNPQEEGIASMMVVVSGDEQGDNSRFSDIINVSSVDIVDVISSGGVNSPDSRTYTRDFDGTYSVLDLSMSANTYDVVATAFGTIRDLN